MSEPGFGSAPLLGPGKDHTTTNVREACPAAPGPPIPGPRHRNLRTRCRDPSSLRPGQPGACWQPKASALRLPPRLLVAAGDNPGRMKSEKSFAALCGSSPVQASSGQTLRHRLNRGGNRKANQALWRIATTRIKNDARTQAYVEVDPLWWTL